MGNQNSQEPEVKKVKDIPMQQGHVLPQQSTNLRDALKDAPAVVVDKENPMSRQRTIPAGTVPAQTTAPQTIQTVPQKPAVEPGSNQQTQPVPPQMQVQAVLPQANAQGAQQAAQAPAEQAAEPTQEPVQDQPIPIPAQIQIGENVYTDQQIRDAVKTHEGKENWMGDITRKSQVVNLFKDDELLNLAKYAVNREELPKDFMEKAKLPESFSYRDEDGDNVTIPLSIIPAEVINSMKQQILETALPELFDLRKENQELVMDGKARTRQEVEAGEKMMMDFADVNSDMSITVPPGFRFGETLLSILKTPKHPEFENAVRLGTVINTANAANVTPEQAYKMHYGREAQQKAVLNIIQQNQEAGPMGEAPTGQSLPVANPLETRLQSPKARKLANLESQVQRVT